MRYTKQQTEDANNLDIIEVAERLGMETKRTGRAVMTCCPWHNERNPSLQLGGAGHEHTCHCYSCPTERKTHGVIDLVMQVRGCDFKDAMEWLSPNSLTPSPSPSGEGCSKQAKSPSIKQLDTKKMNYGKMQMLWPFVSMNNALSKCLLTVFPRKVVERVTMEYMLGVDYTACHYDHTLFPCIDREGNVHNIKAQGYCTTTTSPFFFHSMKGETFWVGEKVLASPPALPQRGLLSTDKMQSCNSAMGRMNSNSKQAALLPEGSSLPKWGGRGERLLFDTACLFGEHLLPLHPDKQVALVESPKNAIVGACAYPALLWIAVGNKGMLRRDILEPLRGRDVMVIPDRDAIPEWTAKLQQMSDIANFSMSSFCQYKGQPENKKLDIADVIIQTPSRPPKGGSG